MRLSAIIATHNPREAVASCLQTLLDQDAHRAEYEIVIVVDSSSDGTAEMLYGFRSRGGIVVVEQQNQGRASARNAGVKAASGDILLFLDDDLVCDGGLISAHIRAHEEGAPALVVGQIRSVLGPNASLTERLIHDGLDKYCTLQLPCPETVCIGPNCSMPRATFMAAGEFDEKRFPKRCEDVDLFYRIWKMGVPIRFELLAITSRTYTKSNGRFWSEAEEDGACMLRLAQKHPELRSHSVLEMLMRGPVWKRHGTRLACTRTGLLQIFLRAMLAALEPVARTERLQRFSLRWFRVAHTLAMLRGARREAGSWRQLTDLFGRQLSVLLYHHVGVPISKTKNSGLTMSPAKFRRQARWLRWRGYSAITPAEWLGWCTKAESIPKKPVLITFDDAYADLDKHALPILEKVNARAAVFVITGSMAENKRWEGLPLMTRLQIQHWADRGFEIGAHTRAHPDLTALSTDRAAEEIRGSKKDLMQAGLMPVSFAYPFGSYDDSTRRLVGGSFPLAFTCEEGLNDLGTDPLLLKRTMVQPGDTLLDLELRARFGYSPLNSVRRRLRVRSRFFWILRHLRLLPN